MAKILVVDDEPAICWGVTKLGEQLGHEVSSASSAESAAETIEGEQFDLVFLDVRLPGMDGLTAMQHFRQHLHETPIVIITAYGDLKTAVSAVREGAFEYLVKPFDLAKAEHVIQRALDASSEPRAETTVVERDSEQLVGKSPAMQEVFHRIALVAAHDSGVLLCGESGTGKELVARAIHQYSKRSARPFVAVNVASLSESLAESELFGHVRGAFTGAEVERSGYLTRANGGTLFLDEVADIPLPTQVKLLRVLEHGEVTAVGSSESVKTDFRVISATHQDLQQLVAAGRFRHDLYYRLCTFQIDLPPLRERGDDLRLLAEHFATTLSDGTESMVSPFSKECLDELSKRRWHGNVRELRNAVEHALILSRGTVILPEHLPETTDVMPLDPGSSAEVPSRIEQLVRQWTSEQLFGGSENGQLYDRLLGLIEPPLLEVVMEQSRGQCAAAARQLGIHRTTVKKKLDQYGINSEG